MCQFENIIISQYFQLNGISYGQEELKTFCRQKLLLPGIPAWEKEVYRFLSDWLNPEDTVTVNTSGSTGPARQMKIRKQFLVNSAAMTIEYLQLKPGINALLCLGANYIAGKMMIVRALTGGFNLILSPPEGNPLINIQDNIGFTAMVPLQLYNILKNKESITLLTKVNKLIIGGTAIPPSLEQRLSGFPNEIYATYGMTETVSHIAMRRVNGRKASQYYELLPQLSAWADENDCLIINAPKLSDKVIYSTDIVRFSDKNHFEVLGRLDHIINSGGIKLVPEEIERKIQQLFSGRFIFSSLPDEKYGEKLILIIENPGQNKIDKEILILQLGKLLKSHEIPKEIYFLQHFPETVNTKISRAKIREHVMKAQYLSEE